MKNLKIHPPSNFYAETDVKPSLTRASLSVLVSQSDLSLAVVDPAKAGAPAAPPAGTAVPGSRLVAPKTELKLMLTSYQITEGKIAQPIPKKS